MEEDNVAIRLKHFLDIHGLAPSVFADTCGIPRPTLSQLMNGRNKKISDVLVRMIHKAYPSLSIMWLLFGEGEMELNARDPKFADSSVKIDGYSQEKIEGENLNFTQNYASDPEFSKENGRFSIKNAHDYPELQQVPVRQHRSFTPEDIVRNREKPRSVVRITVFYDDNSYDTFEPVKKH